MQKNRTIFIGDIHNCYDELMLLMNKLNIGKHDRIFLTGDIILKGTKMIGTLEYIYKNRGQIKSVMGNAEYAIKLYHEGKIKDNHLYYESIGKIYNKLKKKPYLLNYILDLPMYIEENNFILTHAGGYEGMYKDIEHIETITGYNWRIFNNVDWYKSYYGEKKFIYGHFGGEGIRRYKQTIGIDSDCVNGGYLTAYILETGQIIQQKSISKKRINYNYCYE